MAHFARPEGIAEPVGTGRGERLDSVLDWVLGSLVFLPLLFIWFGLWQASSAYGALTGDDPKAAGRPFLQLWQSGFDGHLSETYRFGHIAGGGCLALVMLFVLTAVHGYRRTDAERREEQARGRARAALARLLPVLTRAQLSLNEHRFASPQRFAAELNSAAGRLQRMQSKAITTQEALSRAGERGRRQGGAASRPGGFVRTAHRAGGAADRGGRPGQWHRHSGRRPGPGRPVDTSGSSPLPVSCCSPGTRSPRGGSAARGAQEDPRALMALRDGAGSPFLPR